MRAILDWMLVSGPSGSDRKAGGIVRVLVAIEPLMYRESLAHALREALVHRAASGSEVPEVLLVEPQDLTQGIELHSPTLIICNEATESVRSSSAYRVEITYDGDSLDAAVWRDGEASVVRDARVEDILGVVEEIWQHGSGGQGSPGTPGF